MLFRVMSLFLHSRSTADSMLLMLSILLKILKRNPFQVPHLFLSNLISGAKEIAEMYRWYIKEGHSRDVGRTKRVFPEVQSLEEWMQRDGVESINSQVRV